MDPEPYDPNRSDPNRPSPDQGYRPRNEKDEKGQEKQEEKGQGLDEKYRKNPLGFVTFALMVIWLGVFLLLQNQGVFADDNRGWAIFVWGLAALSLAELVIRVGVPRWRRATGGSFVWTAILIGVGFGLWYEGNWEIIGPIVVIAIGVALLVGRLAPRR
jgi:peptidoglycan/LPS O-acetylase OafA/YrhL